MFVSRAFGFERVMVLGASASKIVPGGTHVKKFGLDRTRINEVVGPFADCEGSEPEGERASQSAVQKNGSPQ